MDMTVGGNSKDSMSFKAREAELKAEEAELKNKQKKEKNSPFSEFAQLNLKNTDYIISLNKQNPNAVNILLFMFENMNGLNAMSCSYKVFMERFQLSRSTVSRAIAELKEHGFIYTAKNGTSNIYHINSNLVWKSWGKNTKYCEFPVNVVLSLSEQDGCKDGSIKKIKRNRAPQYIVEESKNEGSSGK